jgi:hypothetical protein
MGWHFKAFILPLATARSKKKIGIKFQPIRRIHYYRRKHDNLLGSDNNIFWSKNVIFLTFFQKTENRPLLAQRKGHNF